MAALAVPPHPASAGFPVPQAMKCPVGGKSFTHMTTGSYSIWGYRPDGKPYGSWDFPMQLPKCPGNGLVIFDDFSKDDVKRLESLVDSAEYRAIRDKETNYYLAAWLMERLGRPAINTAWVMVQASWQADDRPELKRRYQAEYVDRIRKLERSDDGTDWLLMQARAVNGLRELGRFDEAKALLASLDLTPLDVVVPEEKTGAATPSGLGRTVLNHDEIQAAKRKRDFLNQLKEVGALIEARNSASEPLHMIPMREAAERCRDGGESLSSSDKAYCASDEMKKFTAGED
jgi:hypothetical protein